MKTKTDVIIVGGGMVGLTMAVALAESQLKVVVLERDDFSMLDDAEYFNAPAKSQGESSDGSVDYELRVSAINPVNQTYLEHLAVWQKIPPFRQACFEKMYVWDGQGSGSIEFDAADIGLPRLGAIIENRVLRMALYQRIKSFSNIELVAGASIEQISPKESQVDIVLQNGERLLAQLLIGADGAFSKVRSLLNIAQNESAYQQHAYVATVQTELPHQNTAWQRFTPIGPVAFLPLPEPHLCSVVWSLDDSQAESLRGISAQQFGDKLGKAFEYRLGEVKTLSEFRAFPLIKRHSERYLANRCALIGDAAHTIHPLAGQGVNLGLQDVACLSRCITELSAQKRDFGLQANLRTYERQRKLHNTMVQNAMSGFKQLFSNSSMAATLIRNMGLSLLNQNTSLKQAVIRQAMGF